MTLDNLFGSIRAFAESGDDVVEWEKHIWDKFGCRRAVLVLDSTGFTRVTRSHGIVHYLMTITKLRDIVTEVLEDYQCTHSRAAADNIHANFHKPIHAYDAAVAVNSALRDHQLMTTESEPFTVGIGVGYGELLDSGAEGLYGSEMNFASRLGEDIAEGREILLTEAAWAGLPSAKQSQFEERHFGFADHSLPYYWTHWPA